MNTKNILVAAVLVSAAGLAFAEAGDVVNTNGASGKTRAEVKAELLQARDTGKLALIDDERYVSQPRTKSTVTRAQVRAEMLRDRAERAASGHHPSPEE